MNERLVGSYAECAKVARRSASNFYFSFFLLPRPQRMAMFALYAFLRTTDDVADGSEPLPVRRDLLRRWRQDVEAALAGRPRGTMLPALCHTTQRYSIPTHLYTDVLDGVEMDLEPRRFETFSDLSRYCHLVASVVGRACIHIWGFRDDGALALADRCGIAFQLTNILRDLKEDADRGRIYLPIEDLRRFDYSEDDLMQGVYDHRFRALMAFEIDRVEDHYREAARLAPYLDPRGRRVFGAMASTYRKLLDLIRRRDGDVFSERVSLTKLQKLWIAAAWALPLG